MNLKTGGGDRSKIVVRFDLSLDGILKVTATQPATGRSEVLTIDNALRQFQAQDRKHAQERLEAMFDTSDESFDEDGAYPSEWRDDESQIETTATVGLRSSADAAHRVKIVTDQFAVCVMELIE